MIDLWMLAKQSTNLRNAASTAKALSVSLSELNAGPVFDYERDKLVEAIPGALAHLAGLLGYDIVEKGGVE